jgi:hypothetical protein
MHEFSPRRFADIPRSDVINGAQRLRRLPRGQDDRGVGGHIRGGGGQDGYGGSEDFR